MLHYPEFDPVAVHLGPLAVRWYGLMYLIGFSAGWLLGRRRAKRPGSGWTGLQVDDCLTYLVLGVVVGGRLGYVLFYDLPGLMADPLSLLKVWQGGMALVFAATARDMLLFRLTAGLPFGRLAAILSAVVAICLAGGLFALSRQIGRAHV